MKVLDQISKLIVKNIAWIIIVLSVIAFFNPEYFTWTLKYIAVFLGVAMFGMGTAIEFAQFKEILKQPKLVLAGCMAQYLVMPLAAWLIAKGFNLNPQLALGVILVGCCPGGTASNVITHIADGDVPLSVSMTIVSTLLAPIVTPTLVYMLAGAWVEVSFWPMVKSVVMIILIPVLVGIAVNRYARKFVDKGKNVFPLLSALAIIFIIAGIIAANAGKIVECGFFVLLVVICHNAIGLFGGLAIAKLMHASYKQETAIAIEVGMQNSGLAISLATVNFALNPLATLPGAIFSIWHNMSGAVFAAIRRRKSESVELGKVNEKLCN